MYKIAPNNFKRQHRKANTISVMRNIAGGVFDMPDIGRTVSYKRGYCCWGPVVRKLYLGNRKSLKTRTRNK